MGKLFQKALLTMALVFAMGAGIFGSVVFDAAPAYAQSGGNVPGGSLGASSDAEMWRAVRKGITGSVSIPDKKAGVLVQAEGDMLRAFRQGPFSTYSVYALGGMVVVLILFFLLRGKIRIEAGPSGQTIERFNSLERATHWLTASSFIVLALTGLNLMYGKFVLMPIIGKPAFAAISEYAKLGHNYVGFAFMVGIVLMFVLWVRHNIPNKYDLMWLAKGGGLFSKGVHPPSPRFNAGQKLVFWTTILGGFTLSMSGLMLIFPFEYAVWAKTFSVINVLGFNLPTEMTPLMETQLSLVWHGVVGVIMITLIIAHIYIGSIGMEGAIHAVGSGQVDVNWAKEHHNMWVAEMEGRDPEEVIRHGHQPAE